MKEKRGQKQGPKREEEKEGSISEAVREFQEGALLPCLTIYFYA